MVDNTNRLAGVASITIDGAAFQLVDSLTWSPSTVKREGLVGMDGPHGYKETPVFGSIKAKLRDGGGVRVKSLANLTNSTVVGELANGKLVVGRNCFTSGEPVSVDSMEGVFEIEFSSPDVSEN